MTRRILLTLFLLAACGDESDTDETDEALQLEECEEVEVRILANGEDAGVTPPCGATIVVNW